jgi:hypothetical protein
VGGECMVPWWKYEKMWQLKTWDRALKKYYNVEYTLFGAGRRAGSFRLDVVLSSLTFR